MIGINCYQLPAGLPPDTVVVDVAGFPYLFSKSAGVYLSLQVVGAKFKTVQDMDAYMKSTGGAATWLRPSQST